MIKIDDFDKKKIFLAGRTLFHRTNFPIVVLGYLSQFLRQIHGTQEIENEHIQYHLFPVPLFRFFFDQNNHARSQSIPLVLDT